MIQILKCSPTQFVHELEGKKVICFGAGKNFYDICELYNLTEQLVYVVDNYKCGTIARVNDKDIYICGINDMGEEIKDCILVITTLKFADELVPQLDAMELFDKQTFYVPEIFVNDEEEQNIVARGQGKQCIPKIIHYCWFGKGQMPAEFQKNIETWKRYCPDYEIKRWDESNYDVTCNNYMKQAYNARKWGFVPDYARLDIVYRYGGIYLDTDVEVLRTLDDFLKFEMFCGFESVTRVNLGQGFGAIPENEMLGEMMKIYMRTDFINADGTINDIPSPVYQTETLEKYGLIKNGKSQKIGNIMVLAPEYMAPVNGFGFGQPTNNTYSIHHYAATWFDENQKRDKSRIIKNYGDLMKRMSDN